MLDILRTRSGKVLVVSLVIAILAVIASIETSPSADDTGRQTWITRLFEAHHMPWLGASRSPLNLHNGKQVAGHDGHTSGTLSPAFDFTTSTTLAGITFDENNKPLAGTKITVRRAGTADVIKSADSAADGQYKIEGLPAGTYDVLSDQAKFVTLIRPNFTITSGDSSIRLDFHMPLGASLNGLVTDEENVPLAGARVAGRKNKVEQSQMDSSMLMDNSTYHTEITDAPGTFTLTGVALGQNVFEINKPGYAMERMMVDITPEKAAEQLKVILKRTGTLSGSVVDEFGNPVSTATVNLTRYKPFRGKAQTIDKGKLTTTTDINGKFQFTKLFNEGYYDLMVEEPQYAPGIFPLVSAGAENLVCTLEQGGVISGTTKLIDRDSTPVSVLVRATGVVQETTYTMEATSDGAGRFKFTKMPYGTYSLKVDDGKYLSEPKDGIACVRGTPTVDVGVELYQTSVVKGRVADSESDAPVSNATVTVTSTYGISPQRSKTFTLHTDPHGEFEFSRLPAGLHVAQAEARGFLKGLTEKSQQSFLLVPGEKKSDLSLFLDHGGSVEGFVIDPDGRSVSGCDIQVFPATLFDGRIDPAKLIGKTDSTGYYKIYGIEVGERAQLFVSARKDGYTKTRSEMIELTPKNMQGLAQINLSPGGRVTGIVSDHASLPIPGAEITFASASFPGDPSPSNIVVHTLPNGTYQVPNCPPGGGSISVSRASFVQQSVAVTIRDAAVTDNVNFQMEPGQVISGIVADLEGNPIAGAKVTAAGLDGAAGSEEDLTDKKGEFDLKNLGKGSFALTATFKITTPDGDQNYVFVNPRVRVGELAANIDCDLGNNMAGRVEGQQHHALDNFTVALRSRADTNPSQEFTFNLDRAVKDTGVFRVLNVPRGLYDITVTADGYEPWRGEEVPIGPHKRTVLPSITLKPAGGVTGVVVSSSTERPVHNATVRLVNVDLPEAEAEAKACAAATDMRGAFRVASVPQGSYRVYVDHPSYIEMKMDMVHVTEKRQRDLGKLYLEAGGSIRGSVNNDMGDPLPGMTVTVKGVTPAKVVATDPAGNYLIQGVQFGRWPVVVQGIVNNRSIYSFETAAIQRDETEKLNFRLETSADLHGMIQSASEGAVQSASIFIHPFDENNVVLDDVHYDANAQDSQFDINQVPPGSYFCWASGYGRTDPFTTWKQLFLDRGKNNTNIEVSSGKVSGTIQNQLGNTCPNTAVQLYPLLQNLHLTSTLYNKLIRATTTKDDGSYTFQYLQQGAYQLLHQSTSGGWYAESPFGIGNGSQVDLGSILVGE